ncbi:MAG: CDP-alcohol phosphatidyltransferase family protein, partial [Oscillospiraceae bacterium]|nr:CDP-alcohol phosphatidyltransferase family protein [Oscillospiraceae bacterium]
MKFFKSLKLIGYYNYTVILTYLALCMAMMGIFICMSGSGVNENGERWQGRPAGGIFCLMVCGALDMFDGKVARTRERNDREKQFGIQIDSLADLVSFGVLPSVIGYTVGRQEEWFGDSPVWYGIVTALFVLCALIRLGYFNVDEIMRQAGTDEARKSYLGLPVTTVALILPVVFAFRPLIKVAFPAVYS